MERLRRFRVEYKPPYLPHHISDPFHTLFASDELDAWKKHVEAFPDEEVTNVVEVQGAYRGVASKWIRK